MIEESDDWSIWWPNTGWLKPNRENEVKISKKRNIAKNHFSRDDFGKGVIIGTYKYNTDNWEPGLMTIFVTWQLIVTLDSIRNSYDVYQ